MPRYEYKCKKCEKSFEAVHDIDGAVAECEFCGGPVRRVFHPVGIVFKGSGFYATDSRKAGGGGSSRFNHNEEPHESTAKAKPGDNGDKKEGEKEKKPAEKTKPEPS